MTNFDADILCELRDLQEVAIRDALGVPEISLPLTPEHMLELLRRGSSVPTHRVSRR